MTESMRDALKGSGGMLPSHYLPPNHVSLARVDLNICSRFLQYLKS